MLRQVFITQNSTIIYHRNFGRGLDEESFPHLYNELIKMSSRSNENSSDTITYLKYRISYIIKQDNPINFIFVSDLADKSIHVDKEIKKCEKEFYSHFETFLDEGIELDEDTMELFDPVIESIHKSLRPKISIVGFSGVGKTTITCLIKANDIPMEHIPTITGDVGTIKIGKLHFHLWDFAGQDQFSFLWGKFVRGSDAILIITDSSLENVEKSKFFIELINKEAEYAHVAIIGNKQDLPEAMTVSDIERHLGKKTYSMIAVDPENRNKMIQIIAEVLEMSGEVSPLLKPLLLKEEKIKAARDTASEGRIEETIQIFNDLADICLELGDDKESHRYHKKAQRLQKLYQGTKVKVEQMNQPKEVKNKNPPPILTPPPPPPSN